MQPADLAEVVRLYSLRNWVEQRDKQVKGELGWADFQVRSDRAIRRHWQLVCCAFSFCWRAWFAAHPAQPAPANPQATAPSGAARGETTGHQDEQVRRRGVVAGDATPGARLADPVVVLGRWWRSWSMAPPPAQLRLLLDSAQAGRPLHLYLPP